MVHPVYHHSLLLLCTHNSAKYSRTTISQDVLRYLYDDVCCFMNWWRTASCRCMYLATLPCHLMHSVLSLLFHLPIVRSSVSIWCLYNAQFWRRGECHTHCSVWLLNPRLSPSKLIFHQLQHFTNLFQSVKIIKIKQFF